MFERITTPQDQTRRAVEQETRSLRESIRAQKVGRASTTMVRSAQRRKAALLELAANDPQGANAFLLTDAERAVLKTRTSGCVEEPATLRGTVSLTHADYPDGTSRTQLLLVTDDGERFELHLANPSAELQRGNRVQASGFRLDSQLFVDAAGAADQTAGLTILEPATVQSVLGPRKVVVLLTYFQNQTEPDVFPGEDDGQRVQTIMHDTSRYFWENSYGKFWLEGSGTTVLAATTHEFSPADDGGGRSGGGSNPPVLGADVYGYVQMAIPLTCQTWGIAPAAIAAAQAQYPGFDVSQYDQLVVIGPFAGCGWGGIFDFENVFVSTLYQGVAPQGIGHELGHALLNFEHANFLDCGDTPLRVDWFTCTSREYGDFYDIMGSSTDRFSPRHLSAMRKAESGWFDAERSISILAPESAPLDAVYILTPIESARPGLKALKILRGSNYPLYLEFRQSIGLDQGMDENGGRDVFTGALLRVYLNLRQTFLLDANASPGDPADIRTVALPVGQTFTDPASGTTVQVLNLVSAEDPERATLTVRTTSAVVGTPTQETDRMDRQRPHDGEVHPS